MNNSESENEQYWEHSNASKKSSNFFNDDNDISLLANERIFCEESNTIESFTERPHSIKSVSTPLVLSPQESAKSLADQQKDDLERRKLEVLSPRATVLRMVLGESYSLEMYKSKDDKLCLLDEALSSCDGNAILAAILFMQRTMKSSLFNIEMATRPTAVEHYLAYLQSETSLTTLPDALSVFQRNEQAAMLKFKTASNSSPKISHLNRCLESHFKSDTNLQFESSVLQRYIKLLELQSPIQENDEKELIKGTNSLLKEIPPSVSLVGTSALSTLYYACLYHFDKSENVLGSPLMVKKSQQLSEKQFIWKALSALSRLKKWNQIEALFMTKSWVGVNKMKSPIPFERIVSLLHHMSAPKEIKEKYCMLVDDVNNRIEVATKFECHAVVLQAYKDLRDRDMIEKYRINLKSKTPEDYLASEILNDKTIKWKN